jgi:sterol desaturase/sphingolipid hydroxylase (fatty acid hydroxylase superfamily)
MSERALPSWVAPLVSGIELLVLLAFERRTPLRPQKEDKVVHDGRNLVVAATAALSVSLLEVPVALAVARIAERKRWGVLRRLPLPPALRTLLAIALLDYTIYVWHVLAHRTPLLWRFHVVHHIDRDLDATTALRFHVGEMTLSVPYRALQVALIGASPLAFSIWQTLFGASILFHHANVRLSPELERRLEKFIMTPRLHAIHHAEDERFENANWSSGLVLWDRLHGTLRSEGAQNDVTIGLPAYRSEADATLEKIFVSPFQPQKDAFRDAT